MTVHTPALQNCNSVDIQQQPDHKPSQQTPDLTPVRQNNVRAEPNQENSTVQQDLIHQIYKPQTTHYIRNLTTQQFERTMSTPQHIKITPVQPNPDQMNRTLIIKQLGRTHRRTAITHHSSMTWLHTSWQTTLAIHQFYWAWPLNIQILICSGECGPDHTSFQQEPDLILDSRNPDHTQAQQYQPQQYQSLKQCMTA